MPQRIVSVFPGSLAARSGIREGETLLSISGTPVLDLVDYQFLTARPSLELLLEGEDGARRTVHIHKLTEESLGLTLESSLMSCPKTCANHCMFCFIEQMPPGMRPTLYFKDDDARLSFLMGNYMTLTNLSEREVQRIIHLHISPINVSVHATDPELRSFLLGNPRAGKTLEIMRRFADGGITMNCQIVSCPGVNDGPALDRTLRELSEMYPGVASVAIVPVGVTKFRDGLCPIAPYTQEQAAAVIAQVEAFGKTFMEKHGTRLAWCSDEFYLLAGLPLPEKSFYEDMAQLENGVGMLRLLLSQADMALDEPEVGELVPFSVATGVSAAPFIDQILQKTKKQFPQLQGRVYPIRNRFFGETITVSGLVTGQDLIAQLKGQELGQRLLIPSNMLRAGESVFLDDVTVADVERELGVTVCPVDAESGFDLVDAMLGLPVTIEQTTPPGSDGEYYRYNPS